MASEIIEATFKGATLSLKNPYSAASFVAVDNVNGPIVMTIVYEFEGIKLRWEDALIGDNVNLIGYELEVPIARSLAADIKLAMPGFTTGAWNTGGPIYVGSQLVIPFDARNETQSTLTIVTPYNLLKSAGNVEIGRQAHVWPVSIAARKLTSATDFLTAVVA